MIGRSPVALPSNRFLRPERDRRWLHVLSAVLVVAGTVLVALFLVGWPRLESTSIHYDLILLRNRAEELERRERTLLLELESERDPMKLGERARALGLVPPPAEAVSSLEGGG
jgi:hypothetical protein